MATTVSPLAPKLVPDIPAIAGVRLATAAAGIRYPGRPDVLLVLLDEGTAAAQGITTTATFPKAAPARARLGVATVTIAGIAKGAGMIAPDMATLLSFVFTDAPIAAPALQALLKDAVADTFNAVTIDGDTSTSDTLMAFATGAAAAHGAPRIAKASDARLAAFRMAFKRVLADLAEQVARDGEGARKLVEIEVVG